MFKIGSLVSVFVSEQVSFIAKIVKMNYRSQTMIVCLDEQQLAYYSVGFDCVDPV